MQNLPVNPYRPLPDEDVNLAPFAGRQKAYEHLYQQLTGKSGMAVFMGRHDVGKTALLLHASDYFDEAFVVAYLPLKPLTLADESDWLRALTQTALRVLGERGYTLSRLPELPAPGSGDLRGWFQETFLAELFLRVLRQHRRLVYLLDDAGMLLNRVESRVLPADTFAYLRGLIERYPQLGFVLALDARYEADIPKLSPLAELTNVYRLTNLSADESTQVLREPVHGLYELTRSCITAVYRATGGQPRLLQREGFHLFRRWEARQQSPLTPEDVKQIAPQVYSQSETEFRYAWDQLNRNERLVLTAITSLVYADPLRSVDVEAITAWLIETDYPLDTTAINAALRGLEYHEILDAAPTGIQIASGLMQTWLLENARLDSARKSNGLRSNLRLLALAALIAAAVVLAVIVSIANAPQSSVPVTPAPTVTLVTNP